MAQSIHMYLPTYIYIASKLQRLLVLESEHGSLPGTSPALTDVLHYLKKVMKQLYNVYYGCTPGRINYLQWHKWNGMVMHAVHDTG